MEAAMLYHLELLASLFTILACLHWAFVFSLFTTGTTQNNKNSLILNIIMTSSTVLLVWKCTDFDIRLPSLILLTFVADTLFHVIQWFLAVFVPCLWNAGRTLRYIMFILVGFLVVAIGLLLPTIFDTYNIALTWESGAYLSLWIIIYFLGLGTAAKSWTVSSGGNNNNIKRLGMFKEQWMKYYYASNGNEDSVATRLQYHENVSMTILASIMLVTIPCLTAGQIVAMFSSFDHSNNQDPYTMLYDRLLSGFWEFTYKTIYPIGLRLVLHDIIKIKMKKKKKMTTSTTRALLLSKREQLLYFVRSIIMVAMIIVIGISFLKMGHGFRAGELLGVMCIIDFIFSLFLFLSHQCNQDSKSKRT